MRPSFWSGAPGTSAAAPQSQQQQQQPSSSSSLLSSSQMPHTIGSGGSRSPSPSSSQSVSHTATIATTAIASRHHHHPHHRQQQQQLTAISVRQRHDSGVVASSSAVSGQGTPPPPAVLLFPDSSTAGSGSSRGARILPPPPLFRSSAGGQSVAFLVRNPSVDIHSPEPVELLFGGIEIEGNNKFRTATMTTAVAATTTATANSSRSPSASSLASSIGGANNGGGGSGIGTLTLIGGGGGGSHHCSPNPSPPPTQQPQQPPQPKFCSTRVQNSGSASVARMMSSLLKQQNSIAEEEPDLLYGAMNDEDTMVAEQPQQPLLLLNNNIASQCSTMPTTTTTANGTPPGMASSSATAVQERPEQPSAQQMKQKRPSKCWLAPPDHTLLGGNISPPPTRIHPVQDPELRREIAGQGGGQQQQHNGGELGRHIVAMTMPIATGPAVPSASSTSTATMTTQQQQPQQQPDEYEGTTSEISVPPPTHKSSRSGTGGSTWSRQQSQPWSARGATSKHRKGSLSPNNSLRYSTLMAAAARRNHFQQQRTTSEATPAQRDQLMADVLGHGIREQCVCASVSAPSPRLVASAENNHHHHHDHVCHCHHHHHHHEECNCAQQNQQHAAPPSSHEGVCQMGSGASSGMPTPPHRCSLRFELGGVDSSASSLNQPAGGSGSGGHHCCSQCSSANSLHRAGSIRQRPRPRPRVNTADYGGGGGGTITAAGSEGGGSAGSGSLPRLISLVPSAFPPASVMLSSDTLISHGSSMNHNNKPSASTAHSHQQQTKSTNHHRDSKGDIAGGGGKRPKKEIAAAAKIEGRRDTGGTIGSTGTGSGTTQQTGTATTLSPPPSNVANAAVLRRDPARWNLAATKQRSSSESAFSTIAKTSPTSGGGGGGALGLVGSGCTCPSCQAADQQPQRAKSSTASSKLAERQQQPGGYGLDGYSSSPTAGSASCPHHMLDHSRRHHCSSMATMQIRRPDSMSALASPLEQRRCSTIALILNNANREQAILQKILGPAGLGWLKRDPLLKKSLSLVLKDDDDVEAQRQQQQQQQPAANGPTAGTGSIFGSICGGTAGAGGGSEKGGGGGPGSVLMDDSCSVKQPLMKEKERGGRFVKRQQLFNKRRVTSDYALFFALFGIVLMIVENEFAYEEYTTMCNALKTVILLSTIILVGLVVKFHVHEIQIFMNANSAEDWQIALTGRKTMQILVEIIACAICPLPIQMDVFVTTVNADGQAIPMRMPLDVLFSILMFFRLYWLCRVMLLHSRLFTDAASRSIAGLNRVKTDAKFILKTLMTICPGTVLMLFTATLWMIGGYILRLCERHHMSDGDPILLSVQAEKHQSYLNSLWLIAVTFLSIGYGDIVPNTQCGRIMAVVTGILGTCTSSMVVAVIARKLELTRAEKHVHNFMIESQHTKEMKHIAANVLRETWLIYKHRRLVEKIDASKIRYHQRKFLVAICALRKLKTSQRKLDENRVSLGDVAKTTSHSHELMRDVHTTQEGVALRITAVEHQLSDIQRELNSISELLKFALRPALEYSCAQQQQQQQQQFQQQSPMMTPTIATTMPMPSVGSMGAGFGTCGGTQNPMMEFRQRQRKPSTTISEPLG